MYSSHVYLKALVIPASLISALEASDPYIHINTTRVLYFQPSSLPQRSLHGPGLHIESYDPRTPTKCVSHLYYHLRDLHLRT